MKKTMVVCREGEDINGFTLLPNSVYLRETPIPVIYGFKYEGSIGKATNFERDGSDIRMLVDIEDERFFDEKFFGASAYLTNLVPLFGKIGGECKEIISAALSAVCISPTPSYPAFPVNITPLDQEEE